MTQKYSGVYTLSQVSEAIKSRNWVNLPPTNVEYLVVAGGGGGGFSIGGGGGAGGLLSGIIGVATGSAITVTVGGGGAGSTTNAAGANGGASVFGGVSTSGGGGGASYNNYGAAGGSGGGGGRSDSGPYFGGNNVVLQGNRGGSGISSANNASGSGGGVERNANSALSSGYAGRAGSGVASVISGTKTSYAGGGSGYGATGGGGGSDSGGGNAAAGTANTGGGGGGAPTSTNGYNGGSGIVIISYPDTFAAAASTTGSPTVSTSGSGSINCAGSSACLYYGGQAALAFGTGDFTIEMWLSPNVTAQNEIYDSRPTGTSGAYPTIYANAGKILFFTNSADRITGTTTLSNDTWYHIALCRSGTSTRLFINGAQEGSTYSDSTNYLNGSSRPVVMGNGTGTPGGTVFNGKISNLRVLKGTALYTANFSVPTSPLTAITNTSLLLSSVSGAFLADSSGNGLVASVAGAPAWNSSSPFATGLGYKNRVYTWTSSGSITF